MKYLKKFILNESALQELQVLQEFCDNHLAYLLDKGFYCEINPTYTSQSKDKIIKYLITLKKSGRDDNYSMLFYWEDIKDDLIPFIILLYNKYESYDDNMNIIDRHKDSEYIKISNQKLGYYRKSEIKEDYLDKLDIDYPILSIEFSIGKLN
jgi:hypothetical protein